MGAHWTRLGFGLVMRRLLWASLGLAPITIAVRFAIDPDKVTLFVLSAIALVPLAWLIGEATEHAAEHTGPGIGGFLHASFWDAAGLVIAGLGVAGGVASVGRGKVTGFVVSEIPLVLGVALIFRGEGEGGARSLPWQ